MNIDYFRNFIAIVDNKNILSASQKLFIAQPSLSNQIKTLEEVYNTKLMERGGRNVTLTESGKIFYDKAKQIVNIYDSIQAEINMLNGDTGTLRIAIPPTIYRDLIVKHFSNFTNKYPNIKLNIYETTSIKAEELLKNREVELAITNANLTDNEKYNVKDLLKEKFRAIYPIQYPLPNKEKVNLRDIHKYKLAIPRAYVSNLKEQAVNQNLEINIDAVTSTTRGAIEIARLKNILAIVPLPVDEHLLNGDRVKELSLKNFNEFSRKIIWLKENTLSKCAKLFLNSIDEIDNNSEN